MTQLLLCNHFWENIFPSIWWGIVIAVIIIWPIYIVRPLFKQYINSKSVILLELHSHERQMKADAFEREKEMRNLINLNACTDEELNNQVKDLKTKVSELEGKLKAEEFNKDLLEKQLKMYQNIFEKPNVEEKPKEKQS